MSSAPTYEATRQAWRNIWTTAQFDRELHTLSYPRAQALLNAYLPYLDRSRPVLEAGCGPGHIVYYLREHGYPALGLDYAPEALLPTLSAHPDLPMHLGDVHHLPYPENTFGGYLSFGVVEHFEQGPTAALAEAYRVLAPGGVIIITTPHPNFVESLVNLRKRLIPAKNRPPRAEYYETQYRHDQLAAFVKGAGFSIERVIPYAHSFTFYGLAPIFRKRGGYYETSPLAEIAGAIGRRVLPWYTAFECLVIGRKK